MEKENVVYTYTVEYYSVSDKKVILDIVLSETSPKRRQKQYVPLI